jgi:hypothetical protein
MVLGANLHVEDGPFEAERAYLDGRLGRYGAVGPIEGAEAPSVALLIQASGALAIGPAGAGAAAVDNPGAAAGT